MNANNSNTRVPSEGEEFLKAFFDEYGIKNEPEKIIPKLKDDFKQYRIADFYLPEYKVYVEFFGLWNTVKCEDYKSKKKIYEINDIPCIYIYPENLGIIKFIFDKRLQNELSKRNLKKELFKYRFLKFKKNGEYKYYITFILFILLFIPWKLYSLPKIRTGDYVLSSIFILIMMYLAYEFYQSYLDFTQRDKFTLDKID
jgi:hypothetical protein